MARLDGRAYATNESNGGKSGGDRLRNAGLGIGRMNDPRESRVALDGAAGS